MHDSGMVYMIGAALMFIMAAVTLFVTKQALEVHEKKRKLISQKITACWSTAGLLTAGGVVKVTIFADFINASLISMPA